MRASSLMPTSVGVAGHSCKMRKRFRLTGGDAGSEAPGPMKLSGPTLAPLILLFWPLGAHAQLADPDPWFGPDKALHFGASAALSAAGYGLAAARTRKTAPRFILGASLALAAGVGKELVDLRGGGTASYRDLAWDALGTATGLA